ncbi:glycoside hydrolase family 25 protein [Streptomyces sp. NPDC046909]|uniref:glycoside hydrolase family 25 protein n=1 Tax=Streptomyces sp. NPDC046909 TaxID=3155617 RepID=UPI0033E2BAEE
MRLRAGLARLALSTTVTALALTTTAAAVPGPAAAPGPGGYAVHGVDISGYQHPDDKPIDWAALSRGGQKFVSVKATEGSRTVSPWFVRDLAGARGVKLIHTAYHYFEHDQDGKVQADHFLKTVRAQKLDGTHPYELPLELDVERQRRGKPACGAGPGALTSRVLAFLQRVEERTGVAPMVYTQRSFVDQCMGGTKALAGY